ncbi:MAG: thioredoxin-dependent thiol peroxidase [Bacteroidota bacterium]
MLHLNIGDKAPEFNALDHKGNQIYLSGFLGKKVVLYFYPRDNTPGCTLEACNLRDNYYDLMAQGYVVLGISADNEKSHQSFAEKFDLPFPLLVDTEKKIIADYGVWGPKKFMGKSFDGVLRTTFIISEKGIIEDIITKVDTKNHTSQILK